MADKFTAPQATILIVDDNKINLKVTESLLKPLQMKMDTATSGREAIEMVKEKKYDLIFMDHLMPEMDGVEATRQIRQLDIEYARTIPVIALTANPEEGIREHLMEQGLDDFLTKPIDLQEICDIIKKWLPKDMSEGASENPENSKNSKDSENPENSKNSREKREDDLPVIEGLDVEQGVDLSGGPELYREVLGDFYTLIEQKAMKIEKCLADHMLRDYTIEVHALKSTARLIGATELSERCLQLEEWGREEAEERLVEETPAMLALYRSYIDILRPYGEKNEGDKEEASKVQLIALLGHLHAAVDRFDLDEADASMRQLEKYRIPDICRKHMEMLRVYMADVAMQDIMDTAKQMIEKIKQI